MLFPMPLDWSILVSFCFAEASNALRDLFDTKRSKVNTLLGRWAANVFNEYGRAMEQKTIGRFIDSLASQFEVPKYSFSLSFSNNCWTTVCEYFAGAEEKFVHQVEEKYWKYFDRKMTFSKRNLWTHWSNEVSWQ